MTTFQILSWSSIPAGVKAIDDDGDVREMLPARFQVAIDAVATRTGRTESKAYLAGWTWSDPEERPGPAGPVARAVGTELEAAYPSERLQEISQELITLATGSENGEEGLETTTTSVAQAKRTPDPTKPA